MSMAVEALQASGAAVPSRGGGPTLRGYPGGLNERIIASRELNYAWCVAPLTPDRMSWRAPRLEPFGLPQIDRPGAR